MYQIYSVPTYARKRESIPPITKTIPQIVKLLNDKSKCYHETLHSTDIQKINIDIDGTDVDIKKIDEIIKETFLLLFKLKVESSYTQNYSYSKGGTSHHYVIKNYSCVGKIQVLLWKYIENKYPKLKFKFDDGHLKKSSGWYRLPNQHKEQSLGSEHVVLQGELKDFIILHIENCDEITQLLAEHFEEEIPDVVETKEVIDMCENDISVDQMLEYASLINIKYIDNYDIWLRLVWSIRSINDTYMEIARVMSKQSKKYESKFFHRLWHSYKPNQEGVSMKTFFYYCKLSDPQKYKELNQKYKLANSSKGMKVVNNFFQCNYENIEVWEEDSKYLFCDDKNRFHDFKILEAKILLLSADMGKGKTQLIKALLNEKIHNPTILCVSARRSFAMFIEKTFSKFNVNNYMNLISITSENAKRIVISAESLYKIPSDIIYDYVIVDECESFLKEFSSETMKHVIHSFNRFTEACLKCKKRVIFADAFFTNRTLDYVRYISAHDNYNYKYWPLLLQNIRKTNERKAIQIPQNDFNKLLKQDLDDNKKLYVSSASRAKLLNIQSFLRDYDGLYYEKDSTKRIIDTLNDVNLYWSDKDIKLVCTTPKITIGISHDQKQIFDKTYIYCKPTCTARDLMQMSQRVRNIKEKEICFSLCNSRCKSDLSNIISYDEYKKKRLTSIHVILQEVELRKQHSDDVKVKDIIKTLSSTSTIMNKILYYNEQEDAISSKYFDEMFLTILHKCNYTVQLLENDKKEPKQVKHAFNKYETYDNIKIIDHEEVAIIDKNIKLDKSTIEEKQMISKYYFMQRFTNIDNVKQKDQADMFFDLFLDPYKKHIFDNIRNEKSEEEIIDTIYRDVIKNEITKNIKMTGHKKVIIQKLNSILGMENSMHSIVIPKEKMIEAFEYMHENMDVIKNIFKSRMEYIGNKYKTAGMFKLIQKIYQNWALTKIEIKNKDSHTKKALTYESSPVYDIYDNIEKYKIYKPSDTLIIFEDEDEEEEVVIEEVKEEVLEEVKEEVIEEVIEEVEIPNINEEIKKIEDKIEAVIEEHAENEEEEEEEEEEEDDDEDDEEEEEDNEGIQQPIAVLDVTMDFRRALKKFNKFL